MKLGNFELSGEIGLEYKYNGEKYGGAMALPHDNDTYYGGEQARIVLENMEEFDLFMQFVEKIAEYAYKEGHIDYEVQITKRS